MLPFHRGDIIYNPKKPERRYRVIHINGKKGKMRIQTLGIPVKMTLEIEDVVSSGYIGEQMNEPVNKDADNFNKFLMEEGFDLFEKWRKENEG